MSPGDDLPDPRGWVHLWRRLEDSDIWQCGPLPVQLWIWLMMKAAGKEGYEEAGRLLKRGQWFTTFGRIQKALRYRMGRGFVLHPMTNIKRAMNHLKELNMVSVEVVGRRSKKADQLADRWVDQGGMLITLLEYRKWNPQKNEGGPVSGPLGGPHLKESIKEGKNHPPAFREDISTLPRLHVIGEAAEEEAFEADVEGFWQDGIGQGEPTPWASINRLRSSYTDALVLDVLRELWEREAIPEQPIPYLAACLKQRKDAHDQNPEAPQPGYASLKGWGQ